MMQCRHYHLYLAMSALVSFKRSDHALKSLRWVSGFWLRSCLFFSSLIFWSNSVVKLTIYYKALMCDVYLLVALMYIATMTGLSQERITLGTTREPADATYHC